MNYFLFFLVLCCVICEGEKVFEFVVSWFCCIFMEVEGIVEILLWNFYLLNVYVSLFEDREMLKMWEFCGYFLWRILCLILFLLLIFNIEI